MSVLQVDDSDLLGNGDDMNLAEDVTPSKMEDTHQTYMDMFVGSESDIDASHDDDVVNSTVWKLNSTDSFWTKWLLRAMWDVGPLKLKILPNCFQISEYKPLA